ncbi:hypothetical protein [Kitasatospora acidiphila]|uniref:hypothetical protein n=1 Tax=Kitasatospora acidiphila TaxID=2567942 RepID=UPI003C79678A
MSVTALHEQSAAAMADRVAEIATAHVSALRGQGRPVDLVQQFARPVALRTMSEFLGVEAPDGPQFEELSNAIVRSMDAGLDPSRAEPGTRAAFMWRSAEALTRVWVRAWPLRSCEPFSRRCPAQVSASLRPRRRCST